MADIKTHLNNIKGALYGKDVRGSIHDGMDAINKEVENTTGRQVDLENIFDQLVINAGNSNAEIVDARVKSDGTSYSKLGDRLNEVDSQLAHITIDILDREINVKFPPLGFEAAKVDGVSDDTNAIQSIIDAGYKRIFIPEGVCLCNLQLPYNTPNISGCGTKSTVLKSFTEHGYAIQINQNDNWSKFIISDLTIEGDINLNRNGIRFGNEEYNTNDEYSGGLILDRVNFVNLDKAIYKPYGHIGNSFNECSFYKCNYHYYAENNDKAMHCGCDTFYKCHLSYAQVKSIYIDSNVDGSGGTIFRDTIFENNPNTVIHIANYGGYYAPGIVFENVWFENNAKSENTYDLLIENTKNISLYNTLLGKIKLVNSVVYGNRCSDTSLFKVEKDNNSLFIIENLYGFNLYEPNIFVKSVNYSGNETLSFGNVFKTPSKLCVSKKHKALTSNDFVVENTLKGSSDFVGTVVDDGVLFNKCNEFELTPNSVGATNVIATPKNKWCVLTIDVKLIKGNLSISNTYENQFLRDFGIFLEKDKWVTITGIFSTHGLNKDTSIGSLYLSSYNEGATLRMSAYQLHTFDTIIECLEFANDNIFCY